MSENLTPERYRCGGSFSGCPSVHRLDDGRLLIVGERGSQKAYDLGVYIAPGQTAIVIDPGLLEEFLMCQAGDTAAVEDGVAASAALQPGSSDGASTSPLTPGGHRAERYYGGWRCEFCGLDEDLWPYSYCQKTPKDLKAASFQSQIEEPALAGDEVSAASNSVSLTPPNQDFEAKAREIILTLPDGALRRFTELGDGADLYRAIASALLTASKDATERAARIADGIASIHSDPVRIDTASAIASAIRTQESA